MVLITDDAVQYREMFAVLAATRAGGYPETLLGGDPAMPPLPSPSGAPALPRDAPLAPASVRIEPEGRFVARSPDAELDAASLAHFLEDCAPAGDTCAIVAVPAAGAPVLVGTHPSGADPARAWIFGRQVYPAPGFTGSLRPPSTEGSFSPMVRTTDSAHPALQLLTLPSAAGSSRLGVGASGEGGPGAVRGDPIILGALDRALVDEVVGRHTEEIRHCYQRALATRPTLSGKVVVKFTITKDGTVSAASTRSTMNDASVESCLEGRFMRMVFPEPKGGGIVIVSYPLVFSPG